LEYKTISFKIRAEDWEKVKKVAEARGETGSDFIRRAVRKELADLQFLSDEEKKALGVK